MITSMCLGWRQRILLTSACLAALAILPWVARGEVVSIDASVPPPAPMPLSFPAGGTAPNGQVLGVNSRYFTLDGKPFFPVMGEFHFTRYPASEWEDEILKMKAGGINIVSCYIIWIHHEATDGKFDWSGQKDLRAFAELCAKHGMYLWVRIGPWDHAEVRNGGLPDWIVQTLSRGQIRTNDETFLSYVYRFYGQIGAQLKGLMWKDGGPVIGVQIENEYKGSAAYVSRLLQLAQAAGLNAPFYTVTGWDRATFPPTGFLPVFGGYTEQFWSNSLKELPPNVNFFFTPHHAEDDVNNNLQQKYPGYDEKFAGYPFLTAEMGGGMAIAYHRRPIMHADDSTTAALVKLGSGIDLLGYYMYHGGTNPDGGTPETLTSIQETQSQPDGQGYNDMEAKSYDFQAPLGEFGQFHPTFFTMKAIHLFLNDFGSDLAPMRAYFADQQPATTSDNTTARVAARADGKSAFIFINNYERNYAMAEHKDFQVALKLPGGVVTVPRAPTTIPDGEYTIWPVNLDVGGVNLQSASAELVCKIDDPATYVFFAWPGTPPEFVFQPGEGDKVTAPAAAISMAGGLTTVTGLTPGAGQAMTVTHAGRTTQVVVLSREQALQLYQAKVAGQERLFLSPAGLFFDGNAIHLNSRDPADLRVGIFPALASQPDKFTDTGAEGIFTNYATKEGALPSALAITQTKTAGPSEPAKLSRRGVVMEPTDADFARAAVWSIHVPADVLAHPDARPLLQITYEGDVARIYAGDRFADDNFYKGTTWEVGLWRFTPEELAKGLDLKILPLRSDTKLFLENGMQPAFDANGEALRIKDVSIVWDYHIVLNAGS